MKKFFAFLILIMLVVSTSGCPEQKFPQGKQAKPETPEKAPEQKAAEQKAAEQKAPEQKPAEPEKK